MSDKIELKESVSGLAGKIKESFTVNDNNQIVFSKDVFEANLPEGVDKKTVKAYEQYKTDLGLAVALVAGEKACDLMKEKKDLEQVTATLPTFNGKIFTVTNREREVRNIQTGETRVALGYTQLRIVSNNGGQQWVNVKALIAAKAAKNKLGK